MNFKSLTLVSILGLSVSSAALAKTVCTSAPNANGGTVAVTIGQDEQGQPTISLFAQGGRAHFVTSEGPFVATAKHEPDGTFYTFVDGFGQTGTVAVITSGFGGKLQSTASTDFGMWQNSTMICK